MTIEVFMTPDRAKDYIRLCWRLSLGRIRIERAEKETQLSLEQALRDDELAVLFADVLRRM